MNRVPVSCCCLLLAMSSTTSVAHAEDWPHWRGPGYNGISQETNLPTSWSSTEHIVWKKNLPGMGGSTPVVWQDHIFLTSEDGPSLVLLCLNTQGEVVWKRKLGTSTHLRARNDEGNEASASPSTDGRHVFAFVGSGDLACFDFAGKQIWKFNTQDRYGKFKIQFGMHSTPLLFKDRLYLQLIHSGGAWVIALDKATGKEIWKVERRSDGREECEHSYASATVWQNGKEAYLISHGNDYAIAHRLNDGGEIWRVGGLNPKEDYNTTLRFIASPVAVTDVIVVPSAKNGPVVAVKPNAMGTVLPGSSGELWRLPHNTPDVPSPLIHDGLVYLSREQGCILCLDAQSGHEYYSHRTYDQRHRASPVCADGKIYMTARDGTVTVVKEGKRFQLLATNHLPDQISASPAISGGRIYLRGFRTLYAIGEGAK